MSFTGPKLKKFLLRYYPPGIILQYERDGQMKQKPIDLLDLTPDADIEVRRESSHAFFGDFHSKLLAGPPISNHSSGTFDQ